VDLGRRRNRQKDFALKSRSQFIAKIEELWKLVPRKEQDAGGESRTQRGEPSRAAKVEMAIRYIRI
jgi:hypothetical protein